MHTKINYSKYEYTRYLLFIAYFLSIFCITTINTSSSSNNNRKKRSNPHSGCLLYLSLYFFIFSHFWKFFSPNYLRDERVYFFGFLGFRFSSFLFPVLHNFHFLCFPFVARTWFIYGFFTQWHQTHWILYTRVSRAVIRVCTYFPSVIFVGAKSRGL